MDISAILVILGLTALFFGSVIWMELHSRRINRRQTPREHDRDDTEVSG